MHTAADKTRQYSQPPPTPQVRYCRGLAEARSREPTNLTDLLFETYVSVRSLSQCTFDPHVCLVLDAQQRRNVISAAAEVGETDASVSVWWEKKVATIPGRDGRELGDVEVARHQNRH